MVRVSVVAVVLASACGDGGSDEPSLAPLPFVDTNPDPNIVDELSPRASAGISIHWRSPLGPIRFDISEILLSEDYDRTESFRFSTSTQF